jgi:hypothetical protein
VKAHALTLQSERRERLIEAYARASSEQRLRAESTLERLHTPGSGSAAPHSLRAVDRALDALEGREDTWVQGAADALDLRPVPGVFEARAEGRPAALTVYVAPVYTRMEWRDVELSLVWISPEAEEIVARREPIGARAFGPEGFEMYVRAPSTAPGLWQLVAQVEREGRSARGIPVAVEAIADFDRRWDSLSGRDWPAESAAALYTRCLGLLTQRGLRLLTGIPPSQLLAALEQHGAPESRPQSEPLAPEALEVAFVDGQGIEHWIWSLRPPDAGRALVILVPERETAQAVLSRPAWKRLAREEKTQLFATHMPVDFEREGTVASLIGRMRALADAAVMVCLARDETVDALPVALMGASELPFDGVVFSTVVRGGAPEMVLPSLPKLLVAPGGHDPWPRGETAKNLTWIRGAATPLFNEPDLPRWVAHWMQERFAAEDPRK